METPEVVAIPEPVENFEEEAHTLPLRHIGIPQLVLFSKSLLAGRFLATTQKAQDITALKQCKAQANFFTGGVP